MPGEAGCPAVGRGFPQAMSDPEFPVYLDYAASTPLDRRVAAAMLPWLDEQAGFGNPASDHPWGHAAADAVERARAQVAGLIGAQAREIVWTSGATEANNLAIQGACRFYAPRGRHIVTARTEHRAVLDACRALEREGWRVTYLTPVEGGVVHADQVREALAADTVLVSLMHVNNETGGVQDIGAIARVCREAGVKLHVDAAQSVGKLPVDVGRVPVDYLSLSAHKVYGPKGAGALFRRWSPRAGLTALLHGGGHERGLRSGTLATHQIVGMGEAFRIAADEMTRDRQHARRLTARLEDALRRIPAVRINAAEVERAPGIVSATFGYVGGESLLADLSRRVAVATGAACSSATREPSYVLRALGRADHEAESSLRYSLGRFSTQAEIDAAARETARVVARLRALSPLWEERRHAARLPC